MQNIEDFSLHVFITHYVPNESNIFHKIIDFLLPRMSFLYLRSWARLVKHGTRGHQPWKRDVMTEPRKRASEFREQNLAQVIRQIEMISCKESHVHIYSNKQISYEPASKRLSIKLHVFNTWNRINSRHNSPWLENDGSPWNLLWMHKKDLLELQAKKSETSRLIVVLENDTPLTEVNLRDWLINREQLKPLGLLPSFIRIEYSESKNAWICIDIHDKWGLDSRNCAILRVENRQYIQIPQLYSGVIVLDDELLAEYAGSDAISLERSKKLVWWDMGARSSAGLQFVNVPEGFKDRFVIEIDPLSRSLSVTSTIHHLPNLYVSVPEVSSNMPSLSELSDLVLDK